MAVNKASITDEYPIPAYNYQVSIAGENTMAFSEISGLEIQHEHVLYRHGFSWVIGDNLIRGQRKPINITMKRGVVKNRSYLYDWMQKADKRDVKIDLCDEKGEPLVSWEVSRALPYQLDAPTFSASANEVAVEKVNLIAHDLKMNYHQ
ncbi:phage tail protein [Fulvivirga maritima]|uniref:phage tail protein n=1 Tax=Fulvivirga maritima TaxID=2904247 RepID=UPI001F26BC0C|nr:phage tail protein [Fulvivirga maritima]UII24672.1 phage tail protein [Fulvivirga maritima]